MARKTTLESAAARIEGKPGNFREADRLNAKISRFNRDVHEYNRARCAAIDEYRSSKR